MTGQFPQRKMSQEEVAAKLKEEEREIDNSVAEKRVTKRQLRKQRWEKRRKEREDAQ